MVNMKLPTAALVLATLSSPVYSQRDTCEDILPSVIDCFDTGSGPCGALPLRDDAFGPPVDPAKGYRIQTLRQGNLYAVGEGTYFFLVALSAGGKGKRALKREQENHPKGLRTLKGGEGKKKGEKKGEKKGGKRNKGYSIAIIDFPEGSFAVRDETGQIVGSLVTTALDEILFEVNGLTTADIGQVQMVYSHGHMDHVGAGSIVYKHIMETWMPAELDLIGRGGVVEDFEHRIASDFFSFRAPVPNIVKNEKTTVRLGADMEYTLTPVDGHSDDKDLIIYFPRTQTDPPVMFFVDVIFPKWAPFYGFALTTDLFGFLDVHDTILNDFDLGTDGLFVGGHLNVIGDVTDVENSKEFTSDVIAAAGNALATVDSGPLFAGSGAFNPESNAFGNTFLAFGLYLTAVSRACAKEVVAKWGCKLAATDATVESHCYLAQSYLRVDF